MSSKFNHKVMTKTSLKLMLLPLLAVAIFLPLSAKAYSVKTGSAINIAQTETVDGNLYAAGSSIVIDGQVKGDVICAGQAVTINGKVDGDVLCAAQSINVLGEVAGSVRIAGSNLEINNKVGRNVMAFGGSIVLGSKAEIGMDMLIASGFANINGKINGNLHGSGGMVTINGQIGKDVALNLESEQTKKKWVAQTAPLVVTANAKIGGNLSYTSSIVGQIDKKEVVGGKISRQLPPVSSQTMSQNAFLGMAMIWLWCKIIGLLGTLLIGLVLVVCFKQKLLGLLDTMVEAPGAAIGWGALALFVTPFALIFLLVSIIGIPLACLVFLIWLAAMMLGKILVAIFAGLVIMGRYRHKRAKNGANSETTGNMIISMLVGVVISYALFTIPIFGWVLALIAKMWGLGILWLLGKKCCCGAK